MNWTDRRVKIWLLGPDKNMLFYQGMVLEDNPNNIVLLDKYDCHLDLRKDHIVRIYEIRGCVDDS